MAIATSSINRSPHFGKAVPKKQAGFKANQVYLKTDYNDGVSTAEIKARGYDNALSWALEHQRKQLPKGFEWSSWTQKNKKHRLPGFHSFYDNPIANTDYAALSLFRLGSFKNRNIYVHVTDPGVGFQKNHDRSILITKSHGIYIGPNNGSLGKIGEFLQSRKEKYELYAIDFKKLTELERFRLGEEGKSYTIPNIIHGRDAFGVIAGYIAGGITPESFADKERGNLDIKKTKFGLPASDLERIQDAPIDTYAIQDKTFGNIIINVKVSPGFAEKLAAKNAQLDISRTDNPEKRVRVYAKHFFSQVPEGEYLAYPGSPIEFEKAKDGSMQQKMLLGAAQNYQGRVPYTGGIAKKLGIELLGAAPITLSLVKEGVDLQA